MSTTNRVRAWCFTINNYTAMDENILNTLGNKSGVVCLFYGKEVGENGTPHLQGYVYFTNARTLVQMKKIHKQWHCEPSRGSHADNWNYCNKGEQPKDEWEQHKIEGPNYGKNKQVTLIGTIPPPQQKNGGEATKAKWARTRELAQQGKLDDIEPDHYIKYYTTLNKIATDYLNHLPDIDARCGIWLQGKPKLGKSRFAREKYLYDQGKLYWKGLNKWWDGYRHEPFVLIEDIQPNLPNITDLSQKMKIWTDRYAFNGEKKGGMMNIRPKRVIVTSNYTIDEIFSAIKPLDIPLISAMKSRFTVVDFDQLFNVRSVPNMFASSTDYLYDPYDYEKINSSLPLHEQQIGFTRPSPDSSSSFDNDSVSCIITSNVQDLSDLSDSDDDMETLQSSSTYKRNKEANVLNAATPSIHVNEKVKTTPGGFKGLATVLAKYSALAEEEYSVSAKNVGQKMTRGTSSPIITKPTASTDDEEDDEHVGYDQDEFGKYTSGDYDLDDNFIASDDDFENVCLKKKKMCCFDCFYFNGIVCTDCKHYEQPATGKTNQRYDANNDTWYCEPVCNDRDCKNMCYFYTEEGNKESLPPKTAKVYTAIDLVSDDDN